MMTTKAKGAILKFSILAPAQKQFYPNAPHPPPCFGRRGTPGMMMVPSLWERKLCSENCTKWCWLLTVRRPIWNGLWQPTIGTQLTSSFRKELPNWAVSLSPIPTRFHPRMHVWSAAGQLKFGPEIRDHHQPAHSCFLSQTSDTKIYLAENDPSGFSINVDETEP